MKIIVSTSNKYLHLIPVFTYLFNKYWSSDQEVTIVGYQSPKCELPANFTFHSMGKQGDVSEWSTDLRKYFKGMKETHFIWLMEDCFIKRADVNIINNILSGIPDLNIFGRIDLTNDIQKREHKTNKDIVFAYQNSNYRFSTQPSIWNKDFLLQYLTDGLTPWQAEKQEAKNDGWQIVGLLHPPLKVNEGVRKWDPHQLDLNGFPEEDIKHIQTLL